MKNPRLSRRNEERVKGVDNETKKVSREYIRL
jgi:hypothetical protein